ncbi:hypothetical protein D3C81_1086400 [compost metagenome]
MGLTMVDAVGGSQQLQAQTGATVLLRPDNPVRAQGIGSADDVDQIPAAVAALPLAGVRIKEVAIEAVPGDLIVETQAVVTSTTSTWARQFGMHPGHEFGFAQTLAGQLLRGNAGDQAGLGVGQDVVAGLAIEVDRRLDLVEVKVGAHPGDLQGPVVARVDAGGFVVVPENAGAHGVVLNIRSTRV